jgi:hypothetical protein
VSGPAAEQRTVVPWEIRLTNALPLHPFATGALLALLLIACTFVFHALSGVPVVDPEQVLGLSDVVRNAIINSVFLGYVIGAIGYGARGADRDLLEAGITDEAGPLDLNLEQAARRRRAGVVGILVGVSMLVGMQLYTGCPVANLVSLDLSWFVALTVLLCWTTGGAALAALSGPNPRLAEAIARDVDLFDLEPFQVLSRLALRNSLLFILGSSLLIPFALVPGYAPPFLALMAAALVIPTLALVLPLRGSRRRIRAAKQTELERLDALLRRARDDAAGGSPPPPGRLADLYAQRAHVDSIREWPFDTPTLTRFALYLLIPLASWVGSAFVERLLDVALD